MKRWLLLLLIIVVTLAVVAVPVFLIQPFRPQTEGALAVGYELRAWSPWVTLGAAVVALVLVARMWRGARWWSKAVLVLLLVPVAVSVWFARQNHFEWMFNPLASASYAPTDKVDFVNDDDMVLAVERGDERVAYPVRLLAYHHVVADTVGGVAIAATY
jgi:hypothetical protein